MHIRNLTFHVDHVRYMSIAFWFPSYLPSLCMNIREAFFPFEEKGFTGPGHAETKRELCLVEGSRLCPI